MLQGWSGHLKPMLGAQGTIITSHIFYVDDILKFYKGSKKNTNCIKEFFGQYAEYSGHQINIRNNNLYVGSIILSRSDVLANEIGFTLSLISNICEFEYFKGNLS